MRLNFGILLCKMLWYINTISVCQTDTVSYVQNDVFYQYFEGDSHFLLL